jgi:hypothetical protein
MITTTLGLLVLSTLSAAHGDHGQIPMAGPHKSLWYNTLPGDGGTQVCDFATRIVPVLSTIKSLKFCTESSRLTRYSRASQHLAAFLTSHVFPARMKDTTSPF